MHSPPEVQFPVSVSLWGGWWCLAFGVLITLQTTFLVTSAESIPWQAVVAVFAATLVASAVSARASKSSAGTLSWTGSHWEWSGCPGGTGALYVHCDVQVWMLVSVHAAGFPVTWLALNQAHAPHLWPALRRVACASMQQFSHLRAKELTQYR